MKAQPTWPMELSMELLDSIIAQNQVDTSRIYVTGLSMGGFATWEILQREPDRFAAAIPVCGGADLAYAGKLAHIPLWVFHGGADTVVKTQRSRDMVAALTAAGGHPKYTEIPGVGHSAWVYTYPKPEVWDWLFEQVRK
jgi:predicted peptidase